MSLPNLTRILLKNGYPEKHEKNQIHPWKQKHLIFLLFIHIKIIKPDTVTL